MRVTFKHCKPEHVGAALASLCKKFDVTIKGIDLYIRMEKNGENAEAFNSGTLEPIRLIFNDNVNDYNAEELEITSDFEVLSETEQEDRKQKIKEKELEIQRYHEMRRIEGLRGFVGIIQRGGFYRFFARKNIIKGKEATLYTHNNEKLVFAYYVDDRDDLKRRLREKYKNQAIDDNPRQSLYNLSNSDIEEIKEFLEKIKVLH